jgi:hypothetical protein
MKRSLFKENVKGVALLLFAVYVGLLFGDRRWPYPDPHTIIFTPTVYRDSDFEMGRKITYLDDCALRYTRMMLSAPDPAKQGAIRRIDLETKSFDSTPDEINGQLWYIKEHVPADFPCGPAKIVDSPSAACGWFQKNFWWQTRKDAVTPFVVRCEAGHDGQKAPG